MSHGETLKVAVRPFTVTDPEFPGSHAYGLTSNSHLDLGVSSAAATLETTTASRTRLIPTRRAVLLISAPPPSFSSRLRAGEDAADVLLRAGREPGFGGLERGLPALER